MWNKEVAKKAWAVLVDERDETLVRNLMAHMELEICVDDDGQSYLSEDAHRQFNGIRRICDGYTGFYYKVDAEKFAAANADVIIAMMREEAEELGYSTIVELINSFPGIGDEVDWVIEDLIKKGTSKAFNIQAAAAYYAAEEIAYRYQDLVYEFENRREE